MRKETQEKDTTPSAPCSFHSGPGASLAGGLSLHGQRHRAGHGAVLERVQHLQVPPGLAPLQVGHVLPEPVHAGQGHQPLRVELPCVPGSTIRNNSIRNIDMGFRRRSAAASSSVIATRRRVLLLDALEAALRDLAPVARVLLALLEEVHQQRRGLVALVRVDVVAGDAVHDYLSRATVGSGERGQAAGHGLDHRQTEGLVESRLHQGTGIAHGQLSSDWIHS